MNIVLQKQNEIDWLIQNIEIGAITSFDGFKVKEPRVPIIDHYFTYVSECENHKWFLITMSSLGKVMLLNEQDLLELAVKFDFEIVEHIPFKGDEYERVQASKRVKETIGKPYSWVGRNCENLMNYIQTGKSKSVQTRIASGGVALTGLAMMTSKNKGVQKMGAAIGILGLLVLLMDVLGEDKF